MKRLELESLETRTLLTISTIAEFSHIESHQSPGPIAVGTDGSVFTSLVSTGEVLRIDPSTGIKEFVGSIEGLADSGRFRMQSLEVNSLDEIFATSCAACFGKAESEFGGVWKLSNGSKHAEKVPGTEVIQGAYGTAIDSNDNLYVSDVRGSIFQIKPGGQVELWAEGEALAPEFASNGNGIGPIDYRDGKIFGVNNDTQLLFSIDVNSDGSAGALEEIGTIGRELFVPYCGGDPDDFLFLCGGGASDIAIDEFGGVYIQKHLFPTGVFRFDPNNIPGTFEKVVGGGSGSVIDDGGTLYVPEGIEFGVIPGDESTLYWSNLFVQEPEPIDDVAPFAGSRIVSSQVTPLIPGDIDRNGVVGFADFLVLSGNFGKDTRDYRSGDLDGDGSVAFADFLILSQNFATAAS